MVPTVLRVDALVDLQCLAVLGGVRSQYKLWTWVDLFVAWVM